MKNHVEIAEGSWRVQVEVAAYAQLAPNAEPLDPAYDVAYIVDRPMPEDDTPLDARVLAGALASWKQLRRAS